MNIDIIQNIPCKIKYDLPESKFTQGKPFIKSEKIFSDKFNLMNTSNNNSSNMKTKYPLSFDDVLMYLSYDINIPKEDFILSFNNKLEKCDDVLKNISHKYRQLKLHIAEIFEGKKFICDYNDCMKFYSDLTKLNLIFIIDEMYISEHINNKNFEYAIIYTSKHDKKYDFTISKTYEKSKINYKTYLSKILFESVKVDQLKIFASKYNICTKNKKKQDLIEELYEFIV